MGLDWQTLLAQLPADEAACLQAARTEEYWNTFESLSQKSELTTKIGATGD